MSASTLFFVMFASSRGWREARAEGQNRVDGLDPRILSQIEANSGEIEANSEISSPTRCPTRRSYGCFSIPPLRG